MSILRKNRIEVKSSSNGDSSPTHERNGSTVRPSTTAHNPSSTKESTDGIDGLDGLDGLDGFIAGKGPIGADRFEKPNGSVWWKTNEAGILGKVFCYLADYVILPESSLLVISAWVLASYRAELWDRFPHLAITSPEGRCGKTRLLELLEVICLAGWTVTSPTPAVLFRKISNQLPTILYDEAQSLNRVDSDNGTLIYELFCAGISRNASIPRCVGPNHDPVDFPIYCPKALALIGKLKGILADRCINISMKRKLKNERTKRSRMKVWTEEGREIASQIQSWTKRKSREKRIKDTYDTIDLFDIDNDRMAELLLPLQAILVAEYGDASYPVSVLLRYAQGIEDMDIEAERLSPGVRLLVACKEIFAACKSCSAVTESGFLATEYLLQRLYERREEPWSTYNRGRELNSEGLATLLREYNIKSKRNKKQTVRGYYQIDFQDAWSRYAGGSLSPLKPV